MLYDGEKNQDIKRNQKKNGEKKSFIFPIKKIEWNKETLETANFSLKSCFFFFLSMEEESETESYCFFLGNEDDKILCSL